jgi:hypothetical protein
MGLVEGLGTLGQPYSWRVVVGPKLRQLPPLFVCPTSGCGPDALYLRRRPDHWTILEIAYG